MNVSGSTQRKIVWLGLSLVFNCALLSSCIDKVALPFRQEATQLVVEGSITTDLPPYTVQLSYSKPISSSALPTDSYAVSNASVSIQDDQGHLTHLAPIGNKPGYYQTTDSLFRGTVGRTYTLSIETPDHKHYQSIPEPLLAVSSIDSVSIDFQPDLYGYHFSFLVNSRDPATPSNYYRWTARAYHVEYWVPCGASVNEPYVWVPVVNNTVNILSDRYINGNSIHREVIQSPIHSTGPHLVEVKQFSISQAFYQFLKVYAEQQGRTGSIFDPLPGRIQGNLVCLDDITERAFGYFNASAVGTKQIRYYDSTNLVRTNVQSYLASFKPICSTPGVFMLKYNPPGF